jgi:ribonuclease III
MAVIEIKNMEELQKHLRYTFREEALLLQALTHKSYAHEKKGGLKDNERLEFLGDAVLDLSISHLIMETFPDLSEGEMSKLRASLVNESSLAAMAEKIGLNRHLLLGHGEERSGGRKKSSILADSFEAVMAAVYMDGGFDAAFKTVFRHFSKLLSKADLYRDYKTRLQEFTQERMKCMPDYSLKSTTGPDHARVFEVELQIKGKLYGTGKGKTKKEAEQEAAREAMEKLSKQIVGAGR